MTVYRFTRRKGFKLPEGWNDETLSDLLFDRGFRSDCPPEAGRPHVTTALGVFWAPKGWTRKDIDNLFIERGFAPEEE